LILPAIGPAKIKPGALARSNGAPLNRPASFRRIRDAYPADGAATNPRVARQMRGIRRHLMQRPMFIVAMLILASLIIAGGCASGGHITSADQALTQLSGEWVLKQVGGSDVSSMLAPGGKPPTITFAKDARVSGFSGVNRFSSSLDVDRLARSEFKLSPIAATRMAGPPAAMDLETKFSTALQDATGYKIQGGTLSLTRGAETLLKFIRAS
jgi:heat shock protein HslJ